MNPNIFLGITLTVCYVSAKQPNLLLIIVDDLRPALGSYGDKAAITPNIDQLATRGVLFNNAYVQQAVCGPSRTSFLTSRRPDTTQLYDFGSYWRDHAGNFTSLPQHLREQGYETSSLGKVFHPGICSNFTDDQPYSWSNTPFHPPTQKHINDAVCPGSDGRSHKNIYCPVDVAQQPEGTLPDIETADEASVRLLMEKERTNPFFMAVGFHKPHVPLKFPAPYLSLHPIDNVELPSNGRRPDGLPPVAWNPWMKLRQREDIASSDSPWPWGPMPDEWARLVKQGYYSAVSYTDHQVGRVIKALAESGQENDTIVALVGDHGWSLGEHGEWAKFSILENAVRVPLIVVTPGCPPSSFVDVSRLSIDMSRCDNSVNLTCREDLINKSTMASPLVQTYQSKATKTISHIVELVDLFPSLVDLLGLPSILTCPNPSLNTTLCTEGRSWADLLPPGPAPYWREAAYSQYPRPSLQPQKDSDRPGARNIRYMGYSLRWKGWRCSVWIGFTALPHPVPDWTNIVAKELYDHTVDDGENHNLADISKYSSLMSYCILDLMKYSLKKKPPLSN